MYQRLIPTRERSGLQTRLRSHEKMFVVRADEWLTAFLELESATRALCGPLAARLPLQVWSG